MSLVGKANRTFQPTINDEKCLETAHGATCGRCAEVCEVAINPRHPELGTTFAECTRCRACADACPGHAISFPLLARRKAGTTVLAPDPAVDGATAASSVAAPIPKASSGVAEAATGAEPELDEPAGSLS